MKSLLRDYLAEPDENDEQEVAAAIKEEAAAAAEDDAPVVVPPVVEPVTIVEAAPAIPTPEPAIPTPEPAIPTPEPTVPAVATPEPTVPTVEPTTPVPPQTIVVDTEQSVHFNDYDTVYSANNPNKTEIVYEPKNNDDEDDVNDSIRILEEIQNLSTNDFEDLDAPPRTASPLQYEEL